MKIHLATTNELSVSYAKSTFFAKECRKDRYGLGLCDQECMCISANTDNCDDVSVTASSNTWLIVILASVVGVLLIIVHTKYVSFGITDYTKK
ncbi:hypothetical protein MAR_014766 [Mya arenaria]|uniref:Uncharacterized protein n=1 Tax=Mya arenaria TaxID=6604 RepID=A0ABY7FGR4_MYAAR|nr:hypothetical protein MAR_014766 [Mya arenaria]